MVFCVLDPVKMFKKIKRVIIIIHSLQEVKGKCRIDLNTIACMKQIVHPFQPERRLHKCFLLSTVFHTRNMIKLGTNVIIYIVASWQDSSS